MVVVGPDWQVAAREDDPDFDLIRDWMACMRCSKCTITKDRRGRMRQWASRHKQKPDRPPLRIRLCAECSAALWRYL